MKQQKGETTMIRNITIIAFLFLSAVELHAMSNQPLRDTATKLDHATSPLADLLAYLNGKNRCEHISICEVQKFFDAGINPHDTVHMLVPFTLREWMRMYSGLPEHVIACCDKDPLLIRCMKEGRYEEACAHITPWTARACDAQGRTPLYHAIRCQANQEWCTSMVTQLLEAGADVTTCGDKNATPPLCIAAFLHRSFLFPILCQYGASIDQKCLKGRDALHMSSISLDVIPPHQRESVRLIRAQGADADEAKRVLLLLRDQTAQINTSNDVIICEDDNSSAEDLSDLIHAQSPDSMSAQNQVVIPWWLQYDQYGREIPDECAL